MERKRERGKEHKEELGKEREEETWDMMLMLVALAAAMGGYHRAICGGL